MLLGVAHGQGVEAGPVVLGNGNAAGAVEVVGRERAGRGKEGIQTAGEHDLTAFTARLGTEVDHVVRRADDGLFVLDDHDGVAEVAESREHADEAVGVVGVKSDARLVQDIGATDKAAAEAGAQLDALAFASTEGCAAPVQGEVSEPHVQQELETVPDFEQEPLADFLFGFRELEAIQHLHDLFDGQTEQIGEFPPVDLDITCFRSEAASPAMVAGCPSAVPAEHDPVLNLVALGLQPREEGVNALPRACALPQLALLLGGQVGVGGVDGEVLVVGVLEHTLLVSAGFFAAPRRHRILIDALGGVGDDQVLADADDMPKAFTSGAGPLGAVEAEEVGGGEFEGHPVQFIAVGEGLDARAFGFDPVQFTDAMPLIEGGVNRVGQAVHELLAAVFLRHGQTVDDEMEGDLDGPGPSLLLRPDGRQLVLDGGGFAVSEQAGESLLLPDFELRSECSILRHGDGGTHHEPAARRLGTGRIDHIGDGILLDFTPRDRAERPAEPRPQQLEVVVDLGDGAHRGAAAPRGHALFHSDRRGQVVNSVHVRLLEPACELAHVRAQALHVTPLTFGVEGVEGKRTLARSAQTRHDGQLAQREVHIHVAQVVHAGAPDADVLGTVTVRAAFGSGGGSVSGRRGGGHGAKFGHGSSRPRLAC